MSDVKPPSRLESRKPTPLNREQIEALRNVFAIPVGETSPKLKMPECIQWNEDEYLGALVTLCDLALKGEALSENTRVQHGIEEQIHFMSRQAQMLAEEGNDVSSKVMDDAAAMLLVEHRRAEGYDRLLGFVRQVAAENKFADRSTALTLLRDLGLDERAERPVST